MKLVIMLVAKCDCSYFCIQCTWFYMKTCFFSVYPREKWAAWDAGED